MLKDHHLHHALVASALVASLLLAACGDSGNGASAAVAPTTKSGAKLSADDRAAADFVLSRINQHWIKGADGWTTRFQVHNIFGEVLPGDPDVLFRQIRDLKFTIEPETVSETQRLNGADYRASVTFEKTSERFYRLVQTFEGPQGWSMWRDAFPSWGIAVERRNGQWLISDDDLWDGVLPEAASVPRG